MSDTMITWITWSTIGSFVALIYLIFTSFIFMWMVFENGRWRGWADGLQPVPWGEVCVALLWPVIVLPLAAYPLVRKLWRVAWKIKRQLENIRWA